MVALFAQQSNIVEFPTKSNEWFTPAHIIESAREVMGGITLDPASCKRANETVKAAHYYTKEQNGLMQEWHGKVWCNPPYGRINGLNGGSRSWQGRFVEKMLAEWDSGRIEQAIILLLGNSCFTRYFQRLWEFPLCFHDGVLAFEKESGQWDDFGFGTIFVCLGKNEQKFIEVFSQFGTVARRVSTPKVQPVNLSLWKEI